MTWYFDFISPFAYLQSTRLHEFAEHETLVCKPVLFAGLLNHWGNVGPAEISPKRRWTFQHVVWLAHRDGVPLTLPEHHPFNPLPLLRLCIALGCSLDVIHRLFRYVWVEGFVPQNDAAFAALLEELDCPADALSTDAVKTALRRNGEQAISEGVFGVPTFVRDGQIFWGVDATDMAHAHRQSNVNPDGWPGEQLARVEQFREGPGRQKSV